MKILSIFLLLFTALTLGNGIFTIAKTSSVKESYNIVPEVPKVINKVENSSSKGIKKVRASIVTLEKDNMLYFDDVVTEKSVSNLIRKATLMGNKLPKDTPIYLVLRTPGGSVSAGTALIDALKALPQKIHTITIFAASMGFQIVQNMDDRLITPSGLLMSHRARLRISGELDGELDSRLESIRRQIRYLDTIAANRMEMSLSKYKKLISDEYWVNGFDAVNEKAADKHVILRCGESLNGYHFKEVRSLFGSVKVKLSNCPITTQPLKTNFSQVSKNKREIIEKIISTMYNNPRRFTQEYIVNNKIFNYLQK